MKITITGYSDDLIEIDGDISEEWPAPREVDEKGAYISISDGTLLKARYDDNGIWRFDRLVRGSCLFHKTDGDVEADTFDVITLEGEIRWISLGLRTVVGKGKKK
jgi:hypothetical protein